MKTITTTLASILFGLFLTACGGGDEASPVSKASIEQTAPAGTLVVPAGQTEASASIVTTSYQTLVDTNVSGR